MVMIKELDEKLISLSKEKSDLAMALVAVSTSQHVSGFGFHLKKTTTLF